MKMWRDLSITTLPTPINAYEQYKPLNGNNGGSGLAKWNTPGSRSSYSLPHPAHVQSNQRWQHYGEQRPISHSPSYPHIPSHVNGNNGNLPLRSRPVSMYDMPSNQPHSFSSFTPPQPLPPLLPSSQLSMNNSHNNNNNNNHHHTKYSSHNNLSNITNSHNIGPSMKNGGSHLKQRPGELVRIFLFSKTCFVINYR